MSSVARRVIRNLKLATHQVKMSGKEKFYDSGTSSTAAQKRVEQLKAWETSVTNKQPSTVLPTRRVPTIKFGESVVFLAAAHSGDTEEVERLIHEEGADVNFVNKDGLTALHQVSFLSSFFPGCFFPPSTLYLYPPLTVYVFVVDIFGYKNNKVVIVSKRKC